MSYFTLSFNDGIANTYKFYLQADDETQAKRKLAHHLIKTSDIVEVTEIIKTVKVRKTNRQLTIGDIQRLEAKSMFIS